MIIDITPPTPTYIYCPRMKNQPRIDVRVCTAKCNKKCKEYVKISKTDQVEE